MVYPSRYWRIHEDFLVKGPLIMNIHLYCRRYGLQASLVLVSWSLCVAAGYPSHTKGTSRKKGFSTVRLAEPVSLILDLSEAVHSCAYGTLRCGQAPNRQKNGESSNMGDCRKDDNELRIFRYPAHCYEQFHTPHPTTTTSVPQSVRRVVQR